jgi:sec-independent protein translocase protein TatA
MELYLFLTPTPFQVIVVLVLGVLFFGKNLPQVARQIGLGLMELKKGMNELSDHSKNKRQSDILTPSHSTEAAVEETEKYEAVGTKFEPPPT